MPSKSKTKGNSWELEVSKFLTQTYSKPFLRIPSSGAFVGGKNAQRKNTLEEGQLQSKKGDIHPPDDWVHWNVECKNYGDFAFHQLWSGDLKILDSWINQQRCVSDDKDLNIIFIKISRKGRWVVYPNNLAFFVDRQLNYKNWCFTSWEDFWSKQVNVDLVCQYSQQGARELPADV